MHVLGLTRRVKLRQAYIATNMVIYRIFVCEDRYGPWLCFLGRKLDVKIEKLKEEKARRELEEAAADHMQWGRGIAQQESKKVRLAQLEAIKNEPFSR